MTGGERYARLRYWSSAWTAAAMRYNALGPRAKEPYLDRRIAAAMRRLYTYGTGKPAP